MYWNLKVGLGVLTETVVNYETVQTYTYHDVFANKLGWNRTEKMLAQQLGMKPEIKIEVKFAEYHGEERVRIDGIDYEVVRNEEAQDRETMVLVLQRRVVDG